MSGCPSYPPRSPGLLAGCPGSPADRPICLTSSLGVLLAHGPCAWHSDTFSIRYVSFR
jgi:hypothetical protein